MEMMESGKRSMDPGHLSPEDAEQPRRSSSEVKIHHIRPATPQSVLLQETYAPLAPVVLVDEVERVEVANGKSGLVNHLDEPKGHVLGTLPDGEFEVDEYPANVGDIVVVVDPPPDGGYGWVVVLASFLCNMISVGYQQGYGIFIGYYMNVTFPGQITASQASLTSSLQAGTAFLFGPFIGRLTDKYGPRVTCLIGVTLQVAGNLAASFCNNIYTIWVTQGILFGLGAGFVQNAATSAPAQWFSKRLSLAFGIGISGSGIGGLVMAFVTQSLLNNLGASWTLRVYAIMNAAVLYPCALALRTRVPPSGTMHKKQPLFAVNLFKNNEFRMLFAGALFCALAFPAPFFLPSYVYDKGLDPSHGATLLALATGVSAIGTVIGGALTPRLGTLNVFVYSQLLAALTVFMFWMPAGTNLGMLYVFVIFWGLFWGNFFSLLANAAAILFSHLAAFPVVVGSIYMSLAASFYTNAPIFVSWQICRESVGSRSRLSESGRLGRRRSHLQGRTASWCKLLVLSSVGWRDLFAWDILLDVGPLEASGLEVFEKSVIRTEEVMPFCLNWTRARRFE